MVSAHFAPWLPSPQSVVWARHVLWSVVLLGVGQSLVVRLSRRPHWLQHLPWLLALWAWVPGPWGAGYWLGLAFQIPSLSAAFLALSIVLQRASRTPTFSRPSQFPGSWSMAWAAIAVATGTLLLLDTFAVFEFSIYQWGFSPTAFVVALGIALLPWVISGTQGLRQPAVWTLLAALAVFLLTRWPTGNVWDAVLDPCLWLLALVHLLRRPWHKG
jgi:hypothetical protein